MIGASGTLSYSLLQNDIERLVSMKASLYVIPGHDREDIAQEIRLTCVRAISKYDHSKNHTSPFHFLARCVDNRLRNLLRDNGSTVAPSKKDDPKAISRAECKKKLQGALPIEEGICAQPTSLLSFEFADSIENKLPDEVKCSFSLLLRCGPSEIPKKHLKIIKKVIREIYPNA